MSAPTCRHCNEALGQQAEKALSGEVQMVWASVLTGEWVCLITSDEHCPTHLPCEHTESHRDVVVTVTHGDTKTMLRLTPEEFRDFVAKPLNEVLDDGPYAWELLAKDEARFNTIYQWATGLLGVAT